MEDRNEKILYRASRQIEMADLMAAIGALIERRNVNFTGTFLGTKGKASDERFRSEASARDVLRKAEYRDLNYSDLETIQSSRGTVSLESLHERIEQLQRELQDAVSWTEKEKIKKKILLTEGQIEMEQHHLGYLDSFHEAQKKIEKNEPDFRYMEIRVDSARGQGGWDHSAFSARFELGTDRITGRCHSQLYGQETADNCAEALNCFLSDTGISVTLDDPWLSVTKTEPAPGWAALFPELCALPMLKEQIDQESDDWNGETRYMIVEPRRGRFRVANEWWKVHNSHGTDMDEGTEYGPILPIAEMTKQKTGTAQQHRLHVLHETRKDVLAAAERLLPEVYPDLRVMRALYNSQDSVVLQAEDADGQQKAVKITRHTDPGFPLPPIPDEPHLVPVLDAREREDGQDVLRFVVTPYYPLHLLPDLSVGAQEYLLSEKPKSFFSSFCGTRLQHGSWFGRICQNNAFLHELIGLGTDIAQALARLHSAGVVHLDVKPENFFAEEEAGNLNWRLGDYGSMILLSDQKRVRKTGTRRYMAPERLDHKKFDYSVDVYAWGCSMISIMAGENPERDDGYWIAEALRESRSDGFLERGLKEIIHRAISDNPEDRYPTGTELLEAMTRLICGKAENTVETEKQEEQREPTGIIADEEPKSKGTEGADEAPKRNKGFFARLFGR